LNCSETLNVRPVVIGPDKVGGIQEAWSKECAKHRLYCRNKICNMRMSSISCRLWWECFKKYS